MIVVSKSGVRLAYTYLMCRCLICQSGGVEFIKIVLRFWPKQLEYSSTMVAATAVAGTGRAACSEDSGDRAMAGVTPEYHGLPWSFV